LKHRHTKSVSRRPRIDDAKSENQKRGKGINRGEEEEMKTRVTSREGICEGNTHKPFGRVTKGSVIHE